MKTLFTIKRTCSKTKSSIWFGVAIVNLVGIVTFSTMIVSELEYSLAVSPMISKAHSFGGVVRKKVEVKFVFRKLELVDKLKAEEFIVFDWKELVGYVSSRVHERHTRFFRVFHPQPLQISFLSNCPNEIVDMLVINTTIRNFFMICFLDE